MKINKLCHYIITGWQIKKQEDRYKKLKYILKKTNSDVLVVVFSGFPGNSKAKYNYMKTLQDCHCNQLFILDNFGYKKRGSYYLGENGNWFLIEQVQSLVECIVEKLSIKYIIMGGSSKGGTSALFYGIKCNANLVIIGAPQYYVGTYLNTDNHIDILDGIIGGGDREEAVRRLNEYLPSVIKESKNHPTICIHYSPSEHTYSEHIQYMIKNLKDNRYNVIEDNGYIYNRHSDVALHFPKYFQTTVNSYIQKWYAGP